VEVMEPIINVRGRGFWGKNTGGNRVGQTESRWLGQPDGMRQTGEVLRLKGIQRVVPRKYGGCKNPG